MAKDKISVDDVKHIAELSSLNVEGDEEKFSQMLSDTLDYIAVLEELDTSKIKPTFQVSGNTNVYQDSSVGSETLTQEDATKNAKDVVDGLIGTKGVFDRKDA